MFKCKVSFISFSQSNLSILAFVLLASIFGSCTGAKFLKTNEKILHSQKIIGTNGRHMDAMETLYENKPNKKLPLTSAVPYVFIYQSGLKHYDPEKYEAEKVKIRDKYNPKIQSAEGKDKKVRKLRAKLNKKLDKQNKKIREGNLGMRMGEPLAVFDSALHDETVKKIKAYLHSWGYFNAEVDYLVKKKKSRMRTVTYTIDLKPYFYVDSIYYAIPDSTVNELVKQSLEASHLKKGVKYHERDIVNERERINDLMLNNGYYDFSRQLLSFQVDTTYLGNRRVTVGVLIKNPPGRRAHKVYRLDSVIFTTDADIKGVLAPRTNESYNNVNYRYYRKRYAKRILDWRNFLYPDSLYSKANTLETQRHFSNLDIFKFINVNYDTTGGKFIANIFTSPLQKYQTSTEAGINVSQGGYPGPFVNFNLKNRNTFKGLEVMELNGRFGIEGLGSAAKAENDYSNLEYGANLIFTFPQFLFPFGDKFKSNIGKFNPQTRISSGLNYTDRLEYLRANINSSISYKWQKRRNRIFDLTLADISYIQSSITDDTFLQTLLDFQQQGNNLINSFSNSFVSSSKFSVINNYNDYGSKDQKSAYFRYSIESGGTLLNSIGRQIFDDGIEYFKFLKLRSDYRATVPINTKESFAYRFNVGYALPYGDNKTLPYEKFFFAGGSNSIRAWEPRRLGPGSYSPMDENGNYANNFEQQGEIIFETSIEYRHKIFGFVYGGVFIDAGNIWTIREDRSRPGAHFEWNRFLKEIAVGTGYGLRFDFNFLLMRFDVGMKVYDPSGPKGARFVGESGFRSATYDNYRRFVFNIGIGYPF
ncbi:MAG: BamA/TamA family outer membrane protein [Cyclobacteriaceae bacterium]